jgi:hypothetical protein
MWRLVYAIPSWILFMLCIRLPLIILGFVTVPLALLFKAYKLEVSKYNGRMIYVFTWPLMLPWNNPEDGFYYNGYFDNGFILTSLRWTLIRNPVNGLREVPYLSCLINPELVRFHGSIVSFDDFCGDYNMDLESFKEDVKKYDTKIPQWFFASCGFYSNFYWQFNLFGKLFRFWVGFKIYPQDIYGVTSYRKYGAGFGSQFKAVN